MENKTITLPQWAWNFIMSSLDDAGTHAATTALLTLREKLLELESVKKQTIDQENRLNQLAEFNKKKDIQSTFDSSTPEIEVVHGRPKDAETNIVPSTPSTVVPPINQPSQPVLVSQEVTLDNIDQLSQSLVEDAANGEPEIETLNTKAK